MERRTLEVRADITGNRLVGHASVFGVETRIRDWYEVVQPSFFDRPLSERQDTVMQVNHEGLPLARTTSGTLKLARDSTGLAFEADLADTTLGRDVRVLAERGDLNAMSFGFTVFEDVWSVRSDGAQLRGLAVCERLYDISPVTFAAYPGTDLALRAENVTPPQIARMTVGSQIARIRARSLADLYRKGTT